MLIPEPDPTPKSRPWTRPNPDFCSPRRVRQFRLWKNLVFLKYSTTYIQCTFMSIIKHFYFFYWKIHNTPARPVAKLRVSHHGRVTWQNVNKKTAAAPMKFWWLSQLLEDLQKIWNMFQKALAKSSNLGGSIRGLVGSTGGQGGSENGKMEIKTIAHNFQPTFLWF